MLLEHPRIRSDHGSINHCRVLGDNDHTVSDYRGGKFLRVFGPPWLMILALRPMRAFLSTCALDHGISADTERRAVQSLVLDPLLLGSGKVDPHDVGVANRHVFGDLGPDSDYGVFDDRSTADHTAFADQAVPYGRSGDSRTREEPCPSEDRAGLRREIEPRFIASQLDIGFVESATVPMSSQYPSNRWA